MFGSKKCASQCFTKEVWISPGISYPLVLNWTRTDPKTIVSATLLFTYTEPSYEGSDPQKVTIRYQRRGSGIYYDEDLLLSNQYTLTVCDDFDIVSIVTYGSSGKAKLTVEGSIFFENEYAYRLTGINGCLSEISPPTVYDNEISISQSLLAMPSEQIVWVNSKVTDSACIVCLQENSSSLRKTVEGIEVLANSLATFNYESGYVRTFTLRHDVKCPSIILCDGIESLIMKTDAETGESDVTIDIYSSDWNY